MAFQIYVEKESLILGGNVLVLAVEREIKLADVIMIEFISIQEDRKTGCLMFTNTDFRPYYVRFKHPAAKEYTGFRLDAGKALPQELHENELEVIVHHLHEVAELQKSYDLKDLDAQGFQTFGDEIGCHGHDVTFAIEY